MPFLTPRSRVQFQLSLSPSAERSPPAEKVLLLPDVHQQGKAGGGARGQKGSQRGLEVIKRARIAFDKFVNIDFFRLQVAVPVRQELEVR